MTDWKPVNLCEGCAIEDAEQICKMVCKGQINYIAGLSAQRKLLEYLIEQAKTNPLIMHGWVECHAVHQNRLQSMLKEASQ